MARKKRTETDIYAATMRVAALNGWRKARMTDIAEEAGLTLAELHDKYPSKTALLNDFVLHIDRIVLKGAVKTVDEDSSYRDRLFDILMRRFDALNPYKDGIRAIAKEAGGSVSEFLCSSQRLLRSMRWMLEAADINAVGFVGDLRVKGLGVVYATTTGVWLKDDDEDMAQTMAALDKNLSRAERFATMQGPFSRRQGHDDDGNMVPKTGSAT